MKRKYLIITTLFISIILIGCTNDEGEQDVEILTPDEETQVEN
ncbi:hypothetical protein [Croceitalea rosinachiae]|uniref:Uncharacterized protein n=1 Tax=Croceitalea rosinachiae TaxID=3075596 RepID=A0ABU3AGF8_9FLAO|nr:hypothetical protein [Croceitalea sp. F388]MDT0607981.1 hypothetical protein [Croceitalea sp. F388]